MNSTPSDWQRIEELAEKATPAQRAAKAMFPNEPMRQPGAAMIIQALIDDAAPDMAARLRAILELCRGADLESQSTVLLSDVTEILLRPRLTAGEEGEGK